MKLLIPANSTSLKVRVFIQNNSVSTGAGLTGLAYNTAGLTAYYLRDGDSSTTAISLVAATLGTWTSGGFVAVDATNMPGVYELDLPNACFTSGGNCVVFLQGAVNMAPLVTEIQDSGVNAGQIGGVSATGVLSSPGVGSTGFLANAPTGGGGSGGGSVFLSGASTISATGALAASGVISPGGKCSLLCLGIQAPTNGDAYVELWGATDANTPLAPVLNAGDLLALTLAFRPTVVPQGNYPFKRNQTTRLVVQIPPLYSYEFQASQDGAGSQNVVINYTFM
jgi:hypothetical protein